MAIHGVFISSRTVDGGRLDEALRERYRDVYRVGHEFWLVDAPYDAEQIAGSMREVVGASGKMFVAALTRDVAPVLSEAAHAWLNRPMRRWQSRFDGRGVAPSIGPACGFA